MLRSFGTLTDLDEDVAVDVDVRPDLALDRLGSLLLDGGHERVVWSVEYE